MRGFIAMVLVVLTACGGQAPIAAPPSGGVSGASTGTAAIGAAGPDGGLTVEQALASDLDGPLLVQGFYLHAKGSPPRLCSASLESYPPQCGEPALEVEGVKEAEIDGLQREGDTVWAGQLQLLGEVSNGTITVDPTAQG